jgi:hypothetical protein
LSQNEVQPCQTIETVWNTQQLRKLIRSRRFTVTIRDLLVRKEFDSARFVQVLEQHLNCTSYFPDGIAQTFKIERMTSGSKYSEKVSLIGLAVLKSGVVIKLVFILQKYQAQSLNPNLPKFQISFLSRFLFNSRRIWIDRCEKLDC